MTNSEKAKDDSLKYYKRLTVEMLNEVLLKLEEEKTRPISGIIYIRNRRRSKKRSRYI